MFTWEKREIYQYFYSWIHLLKPNLSKLDLQLNVWKPIKCLSKVAFRCYNHNIYIFLKSSSTLLVICSIHFFIIYIQSSLKIFIGNGKTNISHFISVLWSSGLTSLCPLHHTDHLCLVTDAGDTASCIMHHFFFHHVVQGKWTITKYKLGLDWAKLSSNSN